MTAIARLVAALEGHGCTVKPGGAAKVSAQCPAHDDRAPSLSVTGIEGQALIHCHAGCAAVDVLAALDLTMADLYDEPRARRVAGIAAHAQYRYDNGRTVIRSADKRFRQEGTEHPPELYRLAKVREAVAARNPVFVVEGEKDVHALESLGVTATCSPMGAGKFAKVDPSPLYGGRILVVADQDEPGRAHADDVIRSLTGRAEVALFAPRVGKDAADHVAAGYGIDQFVPVVEAGSADQAGPAGFPERSTGTGSGRDRGVPDILICDEVREWLGRFICTVSDDDLDLLTLWAAHTYLCFETWSTPRLLIDSVVPGCGKTTVLDHFQRLCMNPIQMASLSSPALLARMLDAGPRTVLIDEADRSLSPDKEGVGELLAVLNSGYRRGGTRPVLIPMKGGGWDVKEMPTFAAVAMAGNNPNLPDDTRSRSIRVLLLPDVGGSIEDSDWEDHDASARELGELLLCWADSVRDEIRTTKPVLPEMCRGRARERWGPLKRVAVAAGGRWPDVVDRLAVLDVQRIEAEREEGIVQQKPAVALLAHIHEVWDEGEAFIATDALIGRLVSAHPDIWGDLSSFGKRLTPQRLGRMLVTSYNIHSDRPDATGPRGYLRASLRMAFRGMGLDLPGEPAIPAQPAEPAPVLAFAERLAEAPDVRACQMCGKPFAGSLDEQVCAACSVVLERESA